MKNFLIFLLFTSSFCSFSQDEDAIVYLKDKPNATTFLANPLTMLTQRSLDRRIAQNIAVNIDDVPVHQPYYDQIANAQGINLLAKSKWMNCFYVRGSVGNIAALLNFSFVDNIKFLDATLNFTSNIPNPNVYLKTKQVLKPVNKTMDTQTSFNYGNSMNQIQMLNGHLLHQQNYTGTGKIIAVLDSGFPNVDTAAPFQRLINNNLILGGYDFVNKSNDFYSQHFHGTWVLSCMGGYVDGQLVGTAPDAKYYLFITEDVATENPVEEANWVEAAEEADRLGVDIITSSLGYFGYDNPAYSHTYEDMIGNKNYASKGANIAFSKGIIVVASAGNDGNRPEPHVGVPAEANNVLAIGAVRSDEIRATFSSIGPSFDNRVKPDFMAQGQNSVVSDVNGNIITANGTSFSGPIFAGMIASLWQAVPNLTNQQVIDLFKQTCDRFSNPNAQYGYGIPNFANALTLSNATFANKNTQFTVAPNPALNEVDIAFANGFNSATISFYNVLGQNVSTYKIAPTNKKIDVSNMISGVYLYQIVAENYTQTGKLLKN